MIEIILRSYHTTKNEDIYMLQLIKKTIYLILLFFISLFILSSFFFRAKYNYFIYGDTPILERQHLVTFIIFLLVLTLFNFVGYSICSKLDKYSERIVVPSILLFAFVMQIAVIFTFSRLPTDDSKIVLKIALDMLYNHDYSSFDTAGYLHMFPFNFSMVLYLKSLLSIFPDNYLVIKIFNILFSLVTTFMIYLINKEVTYKSKGNDYGILILAATYFPAIFMSNFIYNDIIATAFFITAIYFSIKFIKNNSIKYLIISSILLSIGNYFRSLGLIIILAFVIYFLLNLDKIGFLKTITSFCIILLMINIPSWTQNVVLQKNNIVSEPVGKNSAPIYMWLNMGINIDKFGFWDNFESYNIYRVDGNYNKNDSSVLFKQEIKNKFKDATFKQLINMYYKKIIWTWTEGTYQVERYGIGIDNSISNPKQRAKLLGGYSYRTPLTELFKGASVYRSGLIWILYVENFSIYCFIFNTLVGAIRNNRYEELLLILIILGFIAFYLIWEIKSRYIYPVYPLLLVVSYKGFKDLYDYLNNIFHSKGNVKYAKNNK